MTTRLAQKAPASDGDQCEVRCHCGALVARLVEGGVELRCRRCKRSHVVPLEGAVTKPGVR